MIHTIRLKAARNACGLTQQQVADIVGIDRSTYSYYELGTLTPPDDILVMLAYLFKTETAWLGCSPAERMLWSSPDNPMQLQQKINATRMSDLSTDEKAIVGLYRIALGKKNRDELFRLLSEAATEGEGADKLNLDENTDIRDLYEYED